MFRQLLKGLSASNLRRLLSEKFKNRTKLTSKLTKYAIPTPMLVTPVLCKSYDKDELMSYEIDIGTWSDNESTIMNLMNVLKESIITASIEYRKCLNKQIEITQATSKVGRFTDSWDDLPQYRVLADELKEELDKYLCLIKTLGRIASDESFATILPKPEESLKSISSRYKELEDILKQELAENRRVEMELLKAKRDSIFSMTS